MYPTEILTTTTYCAMQKNVLCVLNFVVPNMLIKPQGYTLSILVRNREVKHNFSLQKKKKKTTDCKSTILYII